jgi:hypothetical protein
MKKVALLVAIALTLIGCGQKPNSSSLLLAVKQPACPSLSVQFMASGSLNSDLMFDGEPIGGISGIDYDTRAKQFVLITDDRGTNGGTRLFAAEVQSQLDHTLRITLGTAYQLRTSQAKPHNVASDAIGVDAEAIRLLSGNRLLWSSEGDVAARLEPGIYLSKSGKFTGQPLSLPSELQSVKSNSTNLRPNRSFEALALGSDPRTYFVALEAPLSGADDLPTTVRGAEAPIYELDFSGNVKARFAYPTEAIAQQNEGLLADNGVSEMLVLGHQQFLILERSGSQQQDGSFRFVTRLFCAWQTEGSQSPLLNKQLVAEFNRLGPFETANFEGMTFGPSLPDGRKSLFLVADNNFQANQPTILAKFAIDFQRARD